MTTLAGATAYLDDKYVLQDVYDLNFAQSQKDYVELEEKTANLVVVMQESNNQELNKIRQEIKAASALPLIVRRDVLTLREGRLTNDEKGELQIIRDRLSVQTVHGEALQCIPQSPGDVSMNLI